MKKTAAQIKQEMYELGYAYYPEFREFRKYHFVTPEGNIVKFDEPIIKTWKEAREFCEEEE